MTETTLLATTVPGLEFVVAEEASELCRGAKTWYSPLSGRVFLRVEEGCVPHFISYARSVEGVRLIAGEVEGKQALLEQVVSFLRSFEPAGLRFAVNAERLTKNAPFTSLDLAREVGEHIRSELGLEVSLNAPDIPVYVEYEAGIYRFGLDLTFYGGLRDRPYRAFVHPSALNPIIAYAMCRLARPFRLILDPFCGSGTIPLECFHVDGSEALCSDVRFEYMRGAVENSKRVGCYAKLHLAAAEVGYSPLRSRVDAIITNPPFGLREKAVGGLQRAYGMLFKLASKVLADEGRVVIVTARVRTAEQAASRAGFALARRVPISEGGLRSYVLVFSRPEEGNS
ncbi:MAG: THUMP domain-containing protein [Thermofilum sp.]